MSCVGLVKEGIRGIKFLKITFKEKMNSEKEISIHLEFGDDSDEKKILSGYFNAFLGEEAVKQEGLSTEDKNNDVFVELKFHVVPGR